MALYRAKMTSHEVDMFSNPGVHTVRPHA
eukprot:COSAG02_NODE_46925_length_345_cov_0.621951_1_plen_28_part_10